MKWVVLSFSVGQLRTSLHLLSQSYRTSIPILVESMALAPNLFRQTWLISPHSTCHSRGYDFWHEDVVIFSQDLGFSGGSYGCPFP
jgi:hypothetical protein